MNEMNKYRCLNTFHRPNDWIFSAILSRGLGYFREGSPEIQGDERAIVLFN